MATRIAELGAEVTPDYPAVLVSLWQAVPWLAALQSRRGDCRAGPCLHRHEFLAAQLQAVVSGRTCSPAAGGIAAAGTGAGRLSSPPATQCVARRKKDPDYAQTVLEDANYTNESRAFVNRDDSGCDRRPHPSGPAAVRGLRHPQPAVSPAAAANPDLCERASHDHGARRQRAGDYCATTASLTPRCAAAGARCTTCPVR